MAGACIVQVAEAAAVRVHAIVKCVVPLRHVRVQLQSRIGLLGRAHVNRQDLRVASLRPPHGAQGQACIVVSLADAAPQLKGVDVVHCWPRILVVEAEPTVGASVLDLDHGLAQVARYSGRHLSLGAGLGADTTVTWVLPQPIVSHLDRASFAVRALPSR